MNLSKLSGIAAMVALIAMIVCTDLLHPDLATAQDKYGAIAFGTTSLRWGYSYNYPNREGAEERALAECKSEDCEIVVWFKKLVWGAGSIPRGRSGIRVVFDAANVPNRSRWTNAVLEGRSAASFVGRAPSDSSASVSAQLREKVAEYHFTAENTEGAEKSSNNSPPRSLR